MTLQTDGVFSSSGPSEALSHNVPVEQQQCLWCDWNPPLPVLDSAATVQARFDEQVLRTPDAVALVMAEQSLSYQALQVRADAFAQGLISRGVQTGQVVALALPRGLDAIVALLGILKAGACYMPLDVSYPVDRLAFMLQDAKVRLGVTLTSHRACWPADVPLWMLDEASSQTAATHDLPAVNTEARAYVMYTSGSTGTPKGIEIAHRGILRLVVDADYVPLTTQTRMLQAAPLGFDASTLEVWGPLLNGGCCVLHDEDLPTAQGLAKTISRHGVNTAWLTAALFNWVVDESPSYLQGLQHLLLGGEALSAAHVRRCLAALPDITLINGYGPTECTTFACTYTIPRDLPAEATSIPIGSAINATQLYVLNPDLQPLPIGVEGELFIGGHGLAHGYLNRPELTAEGFITLPANGAWLLHETRLYRTGDLVRWREDGNLEFVGRGDGQVKIRGFRIELGEIEAALTAHPGVKACAVVALPDASGGKRLMAYVVPQKQAADTTTWPELRRYLLERLPDYMVPGIGMNLTALPLTANGKLDRRALPAPTNARPEINTAYRAPTTQLERDICTVWAEVLEIDRCGVLDNFFELGGSSLLALKVIAKMAQRQIGEVSTNVFLRQPTVQAIAAALSGEATSGLDPRRVTRRSGTSSHTAEAEPIAIVGMALRVPGANSVEAFWRNLLAGQDSITVFKDADLDASLAAELTSDPCYVKARGVIDGVEQFDAAFFGISAREAELMDPQQRIFLELCWECLERAGYAPDQTIQPVGVFAGMYNPTYYQRHVQAHPAQIERLGEFQVMLGNEKDYITTRVAHKLNLLGPAVSVHTACSTSLVAMAQAFASLRAGQCEMALAGGSSVTCPPNSGYLYQEGAMLSPDGHTRTFDADAQGTVFSDGAAVVLLKRLSDAVADGDTVHAVIRAVALNNDGRDKASFTAPSIDGQAAVVAAAQAAAGVSARSISYIEAHGTATPLGDPVEVEALTRAFRQSTSDVGFCRIGSVKSNLGHTVIAAGAVGVIKTALALSYKTLPASIHYQKPNPKISFETSPFVVNHELTAWARAGDEPLRAGVSSFGVGGTNAHAVLEEAPACVTSSPSLGPQLLQLSARSEAALQTMAGQLADHLCAQPELNLADVAHTLHVGRSVSNHRLAVVADSAQVAAERLRAVAEGKTTPAPFSSKRKLEAVVPSLVWMFPGQGSQYVGMGSGLMAQDPVFNAALEACWVALPPELQGTNPASLQHVMFKGAEADLSQTRYTQPATFFIEYALAQSWLARGAVPTAFIGHSVGEFVAAVLAGVMPLSDALKLVAQRGALMQALPGGSMLSVRAPLSKLQTWIQEPIGLAAENSPNACVLAGPTQAIENLARQLSANDIASRVLQTSHAFHSSMMDAAVAPFEQLVRQVALQAPRIPIISTLTGEVLKAEEATNPHYWARHLREAVRFSPAVRSAQGLLESAVFLELGPRQVLCTLVQQHPGPVKPITVASFNDKADIESAQIAFAQGQLWTLGLELPAPAANPTQGRKRVVLPTYPFERQRYWLEAGAAMLPIQSPAVTSVVTTPSAASVVPPAAQLAAQQSTQVVAALLPESHEKTPGRSQVFSPPSGGLAQSDRSGGALHHPLPTSLAPSSNPSIPQPTMNTSFSDLPRHHQFLTQLRDLFEDVSGMDLADANPFSTFMELGMDSLTLTQAALQVKKQFKTPITFRQLMENQRSFELLAQHLDATLPPEAGSANGAVPATAPMASAAAPMSNGSMAAMPTMMAIPSTNGASTLSANPMVQMVIQQQMQLMAQQLAMLGGAAAMGTMPVPTGQGVMGHSAAPAHGASSQAAAAAAQAPATTGDDSGPVRYDVKKAFGAIARIHTQQVSEVTERQRARLDAFMRRYTERTAKSKAYTVQNRSHLADPRVVNGFRPVTKEITYQIVIERSKGSRMWDLDGNEYVDALNGFGMNLFGWQPEFVQKAVRDQLDRGYDIGPQHPLAGEVAQLMCELTGFDRAGLCNTGSEAVMAAVRIARTVTGRNMLVVFTGSYHGTFDEVVVRAGRGGKGIPAAPGIMSGMFSDVRVLDYGTPETLAFIRDNADDIGAVLVEVVQSRRPDFRPVEFLREVREITQKSGTCLIFDEVITGFRSHLNGIQAVFGIRADLGCYGKVLGGGFPVGVIAGKREYMDALDGGPWNYGDDSVPTVGVTYFAGTFVRHPLALAAAKAALLHLKKEGPALQERLNDVTTAMAQELTEFCKSVGAPIEIRHFASLWRVSWLEDHPLQDLLFAMMRSRGVHILDNFPCFMTTAHSSEDITRIKTVFKESVAELQQSEFLPGKAVAMFDPNQPPVPGARLGRSPDGQPQWFVPNPEQAGKFMVLR